MDGAIIMKMRRKDWEQVARNYDTMGMSSVSQKIRDALPEGDARSNPEVDIVLVHAREQSGTLGGKTLPAPVHRGFVRGDD
jgi:hypothetical protein